MLYFIATRIQHQVESSVIASTDKAAAICEMQLEQAKLASRNTSYLPTVRDAYYTYKQDGDKQTFYDRISLFLAQQYRYNESFLSTMLVMLEEPEEIYYTYSNVKDATYTSVKEFRRVGLNKVLEEASKLDTGISMIRMEDHIYMVRNLVESNFKPYAVIVMELDANALFNSLKSIYGFMDAKIYLDAQVLLEGEVPIELTEKQLTTVTDTSTFFEKEGAYYTYFVAKKDMHTMCYVVRLDEAALINERDTMEYVFYCLLFFLIILVILVITFFHRKITKPVHTLIIAAQSIADGKYGYKLPKITSSQEFGYLGEKFNMMSERLQYQFEKIYLEELALRDAKIKTLQSQINPHFLNNTLEIINWEARLSQNERVSGMIEALSTMLNSTMNRKEELMITLEEELLYVDAYLYIIKQRFQHKFEFIQEIEEVLMKRKVPRLIIQPIVENAVEHGMNMEEKGSVRIRIYEKQQDLWIEIEDNGSLQEEDRKKIDALLCSNKGEEQQQYTNVGIRNVNQRLKILYGDAYGLTISSNEKGFTVSKMNIKLGDLKQEFTNSNIIQ